MDETTKTYILLVLLVLLLIILAYFFMSKKDDDEHEHMAFSIGVDKFNKIAKTIEEKNISVDKTTADSVFTTDILIRPKTEELLTKHNLKYDGGITKVKNVEVTGKLNMRVVPEKCFWTETPFTHMEYGGPSLDYLARLLADEYGKTQYLKCPDTHYMSGFAFHQNSGGDKQRFVVKCCPFGGFTQER